jgi:uroporphyrin-III C-methyltransferase
MRFAKGDAMGKVFLIGAGPGDPELMTLKAARALRLADVVLVDDLVSRGCLAHARSDARVIEVGKRGGCKSTPQLFIHKIMLETARLGHTVARLKGGDPFVFGRGGEEMQALLEAGIEVEVIPGITAGTAVPAALGIPVTHRELARGVTFVSGHSKAGGEPDWPDWRALSASGTTLVIYMGLGRIEHIARELKKAGMAQATPACAIENGTLKGQRCAIGTLGTLAGKIALARLASPAIIVVGEVVRFARPAREMPKARAA